MPYCSPSQAGTLDQGRAPFTASSRPTLSEVDGFCMNISAEIDSVLGGVGWDVPIPTVASTAHGLVGYYAVLGVDALVQRAAQNSDRRDSSWKAWADARALLVTLNLPDVSKSGEDGQPTSCRYSTASAIFTLSEDD